MPHVKLMLLRMTHLLTGFQWSDKHPLALLEGLRFSRDTLHDLRPACDSCSTHIKSCIRLGVLQAECTVWLSNLNLCRDSRAKDLNLHVVKVHCPRTMIRLQSST